VPVRVRRLISSAIHVTLALVLVATGVVTWIGLRGGWLEPLDLLVVVLPVLLTIATAVLGELKSGQPGHSVEETVREQVTALSAQVDADWELERRNRRLYDGPRMAVRWQTAAGSDRTTRLGNALAEQGHLDQLTARFGHHVRAGRLSWLVVTGERGAGKSAGCVLLALELSGRNQAAPATPLVPVLFQLSSWKPTCSLSRWMTDELLANHPALFDFPEAHRREVADRIVGQHVLPVLDGLDEMQDPTAALRIIEEELAGRSFVLGCRSEAFATANAGNVLRQAVIVRLQPLRADEARAILLRNVPGDGHDVLAPLVATLDGDPGGPVAEALRTPFILSLAVALRGEPLPAELLAVAGPDAVDRVERHLLGTFVDKAYPRAPETGRGAVSADDARRYLGFLARHADPVTGRLEWWRLHLAVPRAVFLAYAVCVAGVACSALAAGFFAFFGLPWLGFWIGLTAGVAGALVVELVPQDDPRRARPRLRSVRAPAPNALLRTLGFGLTGGAACGVIAWFLYESPRYVVIGGLLSGLTYAAARYVSEPVDPMDAVTPVSLLRTDRAAVSYAWLLGGIPGALTGAYLGAALPTGHRTPQLDHVAAVQDLSPAVLALLGAIGGCGLSAAGLGLMALGSSAWGRFIPTRAWLHARRSTPRELMAFLEDARRRGVLRQINGYYEFRHDLLLRHLAEDTPWRPGLMPEPRQ